LLSTGIGEADGTGGCAGFEDETGEGAVVEVPGFFADEGGVISLAGG
jgi:hypothetical protein